MTNKLKPCRACGSADHKRLISGMVQFAETLEICIGCRHIEPHRTWNTRPIEDALREQHAARVRQLERGYDDLRAICDRLRRERDEARAELELARVALANIAERHTCTWTDTKPIPCPGCADCKPPDSQPDCTTDEKGD